MKKIDAINLFGSQSNLAKAIGIERQNITVWPDDLTHRQMLYVIGAGLFAGKRVAELKAIMRRRKHDAHK